MPQKTLTAPLALISTPGGKPIGKMRGLRMTETIDRIPVRGIGALVPSELPAVGWSGSLTCDFFTIDLSGVDPQTGDPHTRVPGSLARAVPDLAAWVDNVLLQEDGVQLEILKKIKTGVNATTGLNEGIHVPFGTIRGCFVNREGFDIQDGQVSGTNQEFMYLTPLIFLI